MIQIIYTITGEVAGGVVIERKSSSEKPTDFEVRAANEFCRMVELSMLAEGSMELPTGEGSRN